jgi:hypothetical protein
VGVTLQWVIEHVRATQGLEITAEKLYARAWNVENTASRTNTPRTSWRRTTSS